MEFLNFISSSFVAGSEGKTFSKVSPFDGAVLGSVVDSGAFDFITALQGAKKAATTFKNSSFLERADFLDKMAQHLSQHSAEISYQEALHQGLASAFVREASVASSVGLLQAIAQDLRSFSSTTEIPSPVGVIGIITPWSCSLKLVMERLAPALAAGNAVIIKVSEHSPITAKIVGEAVVACGLPAGVVQILQGKSEVAELIASHPGIRAVSAVGRPATVESIAKASVAQLKKVQLSGGAKNALIVLADADYENHMAEILKPFLMGQGQMCWNTSRLFIPESLAPAFMEKAKSYIQNLQPLKNPEGSEMWTPLISADRVEELKSTAQTGVQEHGKLVAGGDVAAGNFIRPVLMQDLPQCSVFQQDEVAGPLILVTPVKYQHEAVKWANTSYLAHSAVVWGSPEKTLKVSGQLEVSYVWSNSWIDAKTPTILGQKQSSFGLPDMSWRGDFYSDVKKLAGA
ncbi:2-hydroxymuconic semialdehyde dehydrogenase [Bdellovibrio bacteriovorus]|uniref:2-hydroxymuconic semialdehyde dehydrogenase n=1 Tax=Bdellovibrio bacteriovorus TaxID=959 RepID=A0A150WRY5_BDEBC|nr:aldehyde dehydrogenase family protein [Bdellovibrio bacteriovorus]KYG67200.1 2-hydroxymuconic semialdehyde dehydrogenase [Bdellovibrio bacteriovorus]